MEQKTRGAEDGERKPSSVHRQHRSGQVRLLVPDGSQQKTGGRWQTRSLKPELE